MKQKFIKPLAFAISTAIAASLTGCGDAETTIVELPSLPVEEEAHDDHDDHDHGEGTPDGEAVGRLLVVNTEAGEAQVFDLEDSDLLTSLTLDGTPSAVHATAGYRYAALVEREADKVSFIDGGLWQEEHGDHFDLFSEMPSLLNFGLTGSKPTHFATHEGQVALFLDGDAATGSNAGVQVFDDHAIEEEESPVSLEFSMAQHGVAEPRGEYLIASLRRDDALSTSSTVTLPDQVAVYHLHDGEYELEQTFEVACPDLHGAAQNEDHVVFGCSDGVLLVTDDSDGNYSAQKLANPEELGTDLRIGSLWGHHESGVFIAKASGQASDLVQFFAIEAEASEIELIDWQPVTDASPVASDFSFEAEQFVILDDQGQLTVLEPHEEDGHTHWEFGGSLAISNEDVSTMPDGMNFSFALAQNSHTVYVADPIAQHIVVVDLELLEDSGEIGLDYSPAMLTWLGVVEEHEH